MIEELLTKHFIEDKGGYYKEIIKKYFDEYCIKVYGVKYEYNLNNLKVFFSDLFKIESGDYKDCFKIKSKIDLNETDLNYNYISIVDYDRISDFYDLRLYIEQQLNYE